MRKLKIPNSGLVKSGPLQFNEDPPGFYIRGVTMVMLRRLLLECYKALVDEGNLDLIKQIDAMLAIMDKGVRKVYQEKDAKHIRNTTRTGK